MPSTPPDTTPRATATETFACDFVAARAACRRLCEFLTQQGVPAAELFSCELALAEACNNAVQHVGEDGRGCSIVAQVGCSQEKVEIRVTDHTGGFEWPTTPPTPPPLDAEHGRGLFIIRSVMDGATYERGSGSNTLTMWKARTSRT